MTGRVALHMDGTVRDPKRLEDIDYLQRLILRAVMRAGMTLLNMHLTNVPVDVRKLGREPFEDEGGISIGALISTSHIYLHVWPQRSRFMFDLVSCRPFDTARMGEWLYDELRVEKIEYLHEVSCEADRCIDGTAAG